MILPYSHSSSESTSWYENAASNGYGWMRTMQRWNSCGHKPPERKYAADRHYFHDVSYIEYKAKRMWYTLKKPTYYLWKTDFHTEEEFNQTKEKYTNLGFRVVTYLDGNNQTDIHSGIKALIQNHWNQCWQITVLDIFYIYIMLISKFHYERM